MALLHQATLHPTKLELLAGWLPGRGWHTGPAGAVRRVATFRFDDPADAVGIETMLVQVGDGPVLQVPLTYRAAPLLGGDYWLLGTIEHSVLGRRWVYDGCGDAVYAAALAGAIFGNTGQAEQLVQVDGGVERREPNMSITGSEAGDAVPAVHVVRQVADGDPTVIATDTVDLAVIRRLGGDSAVTGAVLRGTWPGQTAPAPLAFVP